MDFGVASPMFESVLLPPPTRPEVLREANAKNPGSVSDEEIATSEQYHGRVERLIRG